MAKKGGPTFGVSSCEQPFTRSLAVERVRQRSAQERPQCCEPTTSSPPRPAPCHQGESVNVLAEDTAPESSGQQVILPSIPAGPAHRSPWARANRAVLSEVKAANPGPVRPTGAPARPPRHRAPGRKLPGSSAELHSGLRAQPDKGSGPHLPQDTGVSD